MPASRNRSYQFVVLLVSLLIIAGNSWSAETDPDGRLFAGSADPLLDVQQAIARAEDSGRLVLVVLGGNWCHDSRALAARLNRSPLSDVIDQEYELVFVDVGFLDQGRSVLQTFGVAHFYATPTVLIIDPASGRLINNEDRHIWGNAYNIDMPASVEYFENWAVAERPADTATAPPELERLNADIDRFENQLAERVEAGYVYIGPLLKEHKGGNTPDELDAKWNELRDFRMAIPGDIQALRDEAARRVAAGERHVILQYPDYPLMSWETT